MPDAELARRAPYPHPHLAPALALALALTLTLNVTVGRCASLLEAAEGALDDAMGGGAARFDLAAKLRDRCVELGAELGARFNLAAKLKMRSGEAAR